MHSRGIYTVENNKILQLNDYKKLNTIQLYLLYIPSIFCTYYSQNFLV